MREEQDICMLNSNEVTKSFWVILPVKFCSTFLASGHIGCSEDYFRGGSMANPATHNGGMVLTGRWAQNHSECSMFFRVSGHNRNLSA